MKIRFLVLTAWVAGVMQAGVGAQVSGSLYERLVLDSSDVVDWGRVSVSYAWKEQDSVLLPSALLKFDLSDLQQGAIVRSATLNFYVEESQPGGTVSVHHVANDGWSFLESSHAELYNWPTDHLLASYNTGTVGWKHVDVTADLTGSASANSELSIKWEGTGYAAERITSPSSLDSDHRPYLKIAYLSLLPVGAPDLTLGPADIVVSDPTPNPSQALQVTVAVHNNGNLPVTSVPVHLFDGRPENGALVASGTIPLIYAGGDVRRLTFAATAVPGQHRLWAVVDWTDSHGELDEHNNRAFTDLFVGSAHDEYAEDFEEVTPAGTGTGVWHAGESGLGSWRADADVPYDANTGLPRQWRIMRTRTEAYTGHASLSMFLDGRSDDGTIWIERWIPVDPGSDLTVDLSWAFGIQADMATSPVFYIGMLDPESEADFTVLPVQPGWAEYAVSRQVSTGDRTRLWVAVGLTVSWETEVWHWLDHIGISVQ